MNKISFILRASRCKLAFFLLLLFLYSSTVAQKIENEKDIPKTFLALNLLHTSNTVPKHGFSISLNSPGFMSLLLSEISVVYKDKNYNSYSVSFGALYGLIGINKTLYKFNSSYVYGNVVFGVFRNWYNLGSLGISYLLYDKKKTISFEFSFDGFFHHGQGGSGDLILGELSNYNTRGLMSNITISKRLFENFTFSLSGGLSYTTYQYAKFKFNPYVNEGKYYFITKEEANIGNYIEKPKWKGYLLFPVGITISYHF